MLVGGAGIDKLLGFYSPPPLLLLLLLLLADPVRRLRRTRHSVELCVPLVPWISHSNNVREPLDLLLFPLLLERRLLSAFFVVAGAFAGIAAAADDAAGLPARRWYFSCRRSMTATLTGEPCSSE